MADTSLDAVVVAGGSAATMGFAEEISFGKTPPVVELKRQRIVSTTLSSATEMYSSNEPTRDRQGSAPRHGVRRASGDIAIELSPNSHQSEYEALLGGYWQTPTPIAISTVNLTATLVGTGEDATVEVTASSFDFAAAQLYVGAPVSFTGAHADVNGKKFIVIGHAANKVILLPPAGFTLAGSPQALSAGTFHLMGARLGMGPIMRSFVQERAFEDIGRFWVFNGILYNTFSAELPPTGIATGTFGVLGRAAATLVNGSIDGVTEVALDDTDCTSLTFDRETGTITRATGSWITDTFVAGDKVQFSGEGITEVQNRQIRTVTAVTATVLTVEEAIADGTYTTDYYVLKVGSPTYTENSDEDVLVSVSGAILVNGERVGVATGLTLNVDNQMTGDPIVGSNSIPFYSYGTTARVTVNPTVFFTRGGAGETLLNAALNETAVSVVLSLDTRDNDDSLSFVFPYAIFAPGQFSNDASISIAMEGEAAKPPVANPELGTSKIYIYDTTITGVAPPVEPLDLVFVSEAAGVATFNIVGGVAPYVFEPDGAGSPVTKFVAGQFTYDYNANDNFDPTLTDAVGTEVTEDVTITTN